MLDAKYKTLLAIEKEGSFTKAASKLGFTQPAVSNQIRLIEEEFGVKVFRRDGKSLVLTPEGEILAKYAHRMVNLTDNARQAIKDFAKSIKRLSIGITHTVKENFVPQALADYCNVYPQLHIKLIIDTIKKIYLKMKLYEIDFAIIDGNFTDGNYNSVLLDTDYLCLAVSANHSLAKKTSVSLEELKKERFILRLQNSDSRTLFENQLSARGESIENFNVILEVDSVTTIKELVARNLGVSVISYSACLGELQRGELALVPIENISMPRQINLVYHRDFPHPEVLTEIRDLYRKQKRPQTEI